jgi:3(or 17)beta-hydroxysteroid dehydrogenase
MSLLNGKIALVTGGASGLGRAIAERLAADQATVVITDIAAEYGLRAAAEIDCMFLKQDVRDEARWDAVIREVKKKFGSLHILVNNAGILGPRQRVDPEQSRLSDWRDIFAVNVEGVFLGCRAAIPALAASGGGAIVNMSSVAGLLATPYATAYGASKATVRHLTKSVAQHCAEKGLKVRCNSVHPGDVLTPMWLRHVQETASIGGLSVDEVVAEAQSEIPLGDFTRAEDVAGAVAFLVSDDSRHITGEQLIVDGGILHCDTYRPQLPE